MNGAVLRLLDANANRTREGLRVVEDYARFVLDSKDLSSSIKTLRHDLSAILRPLLPDAILHRDTPGDVGTGNKTQAELRREDVAEVITAAGKRVGEGLRAIEEYLKTVAPADASHVEQLRYRFYDIEQRLARTIRPATPFANVRLYVLITEKCCRRNWLEVAEEALIGGADCLQLREKDLESGQMLHRARQLVELCRRYQRICIINDRPDIAILSDADGVHVGQDDLPAIEVRKLIGARKILGISTHRIEQARQAVLDGADYIGVGPIFRSGTKPRDHVAGLGYARQVAAEVRIPAVAIAGITAGNVDEVLGTGVQAVAVTAAVLDTDNPRTAAAELKQKLPVGQAFPPAMPPNLVGQTFLSAAPAVPPIPPVGQAFLPAVPPVPPAVPPVGQTFLSATDRSPSQPTLQITRRHLPHWQLDGSTYFVTFRLAAGELTPPERRIVLDHVKSGAGTFYTLIAATVMPDHVHLLFSPKQEEDLSRIMKGIKGVSAHLLNRYRASRGKVWQVESFDRIVRDQKELDEKLEYMLNNARKKDLVEDPWTYDGWYYNKEWEAEAPGNRVE